ncbi:tripartite motif-containing protein 2-like [Argopecten irradians]|uniref:tripartite motif-containing protein 2-like n=1 Tax=Argopecten irradians TaxID=31199 RepID=UPI003718015F
MAEGGSSQDNLAYDNDTRLLVSRLLECPICLEQMRQPKSLPCLHSFCEECLGTYIATDVSGEMASILSFPCPVCRKITFPVKPSEDKTKWAQHFSTNYHITRLIDRLKRKDTKLICGPCKTTKNEENPAQLYCKTNGMLFCELCKSKFHDVVHKGCDITHITQTSMQHLEPVSPALCPTHSGQEMDCYCEDHRFVGCNKCIITEHRQCGSVKTTKEYIEKQINMDKLFDTASNSIERIVQTFDSQVDTIKRCQDDGLEDIQRLRLRINSHLDRKQVEITQQLNTAYKTEKAKVDLYKRKFQRLRASMLNTKESLRMALLREDYTESIELYQRGRAETEAFDDLLDELEKKHSPRSPSITKSNLVTKC